MIESEPRLDWGGCRDLLLARIAEPAPGRIQLLTGPRQVGKTTLLLDLAQRLGERAIYATMDDGQVDLGGRWLQLWQRSVEQATARRPAVLLLDEIQTLHDWSARMKAGWDRLRRIKAPVHVIASGSSALHLGVGARESLAGRFERVVLSHWSASALGSAFRMRAERAVDTLVRFGAYPGAVEFLGDPQRWRAYVQGAIIEPAIGRDIMAMAVVRRPALLRQVFSLCASLPAQIVALQKLQGHLHDPGALETIAQYLQLLREAYLVAPLQRFSDRALRRRASPPKIVVLSNAFLAALDPGAIPDATRDPARFGQWVENACLAWAWNSGIQVSYWREEPLEVDGIFEGAWGDWAVEIKTGDWNGRDLAGVLEFCARQPRFRPLLLTGAASVARAREFGVVAQDWREFLRSGPPAAAR